MTNLVAVHLEYIEMWEVWVFKKVVDLQVGGEGGPLGVEGDGPVVGDFAAAHGCLRSVEITEERTYVGGWHMVQESGECEEYLKRNSSRKV